MRIVITGATGFIGSHLACKFLEEGGEVFACLLYTSDAADEL